MSFKPEDANRSFERTAVSFDEESFFEGVLKNNIS